MDGSTGRGLTVVLGVGPMDSDDCRGSSAALRRNRLESILISIYPEDAPWDVRLWSDVESRILGLDDLTYNLVAAAITRLEAEGPRLGRPTADRIRGSRHHNMKELRPGSAGHSEIRICSPSTPSVERSS